MKNLKLNIIVFFKSFLFIWVFFLVSSLKAQVENANNFVNNNIEKVHIPKKNIENYKKIRSFDYSEEINEKGIITKALNWLINVIKDIIFGVLKWIFGVKKAASYLQSILKALPYIAVIIFVFFLFKYLLGIDLLRLKTKKNARLSLVNLTDEERIIKEENLQKLIQKAIADKNYRLAVRYHYLSILKLLIDKELLDWKPEKTNNDYVLELSKTKFSSNFKHLTYLYDYVWYGNFIPKDDDFKQINQKFNDFSLQ